MALLRSEWSVCRGVAREHGAAADAARCRRPPAPPAASPRVENGTLEPLVFEVDDRATAHLDRWVDNWVNPAHVRRASLERLWGMVPGTDPETRTLHFGVMAGERTAGAAAAPAGAAARTAWGGACPLVASARRHSLLSPRPRPRPDCSAEIRA